MLLLIAVILLYFGLKPLRHSRRQAAWIQATAKIVDLREAEEQETVSGAARIVYHYPEIDYEYAVDGKSYRGDTVSAHRENVRVAESNAWGDPGPDSARWWRALKPGDAIPVFVNPENHADAVLVTSVTKSRRSHYLALTAAGILLVAAWLLVFGCAMIRVCG